MAQWYSLGCSDCRVFVGLHKFLPTEAWYRRFDGSHFDRDLFPGGPSYDALRVKADEFERELEAIALASQPDYVQQLVPTLLKFIRTHRDHQLFVVGDIGDRPWDRHVEDWRRWAEAPWTGLHDG